MRVFISIKYHEDNGNRQLIQVIADALAANGCETICIVRDVEKWGECTFSAEALMEQTFASIRACDVMVVDASEKGVGIGIEAGYARAAGKPIWVIARQGADISETLKGIADTVRAYGNPKELEQILGAVLKEGRSALAPG